MKIAIFSDTFPPQTNGVANVAYLSARGLAERGHEVFVFTVLPKIKDPKNSTYDNITVISLPSIPALIYPSERFTLPLGFSLNKLRKIKPDIIHTHTPLSVGMEAILGAKLLKIPLIGTHHTFYDHYLKYLKMDHRLGRKISWRLTTGYYNCCDAVLSPSASLAESLQTFGLKKPIEIIQNFVDIDLFKPAADQATKEKIKKHWGIKNKSVTYMGRLGYEKSIDQLLLAFALMLKKIPDLTLMLIGDGPERANLEKLAEELKIKDQIIFTGFLYKEELAQALQANEVFLTASKSENLPLSILEGMAVQLPVVSVKEKGLAELTREGVNGFFVKTDDPTDIAEKTLAILNDPNVKEKFGRASREIATEYSLKKIISLMENAYKKLSDKINL